MVDATASFDGNAATAVARPSQGVDSAGAAVCAASAEVVSAYADFCRSALFAPAQGPLWVHHWLNELRPDALIATASRNGRPLLSLALEATQSGPFRIARFMGGRHANGNFPASEPAWLAKGDFSILPALFQQIIKARPDIDLIALERLLPDRDGVANPLLSLPHFASPNLALAVDLDGGFDALLADPSGKRKRKKHRSQLRKFQAAGSFRRIEGRAPVEVETLLDAFFEMKASRFASMGIANVFGEEQVRAFFHAIFRDALEEQTPPFALHGLEVAGKLRAVTGSSVCGRRLICEFGAIADDDLGHASPGEFLFFDNIEEACQRGFGFYDFSVGDEPYKRQWCDIEVQHQEVLVPLTLKGKALAFALRRQARAKALVKNNPTLWEFAKRLRRRAGGRAAAPADDEG